MAASHGSKCNQTFPLGQDNHHTTLRVENNQSRRRPTSWSLSKLPDSSLYLQLLSRGKTFPLVSPETDGPIVGKSREKVELLSLTLPLQFYFPFSLSFPLLSNRLGEDRIQVRCPLTCLLSNYKWLLGLPFSPYPSTLDFPPIMCYHVSSGSHLSYLFY